MKHIKFHLNLMEKLITVLKEMNKLNEQKELSHMMLIRHHECTQDMEFRHLSSVHRLRRDQQQNQHQTEWNSQVQYNKRVEMELRKRHLFELKMQPKTLKVRRILTTGALRASQKLIGVPRGEQSAPAWTASCHSQKRDRTLQLHVTF